MKNWAFEKISLIFILNVRFTSHFKANDTKKTAQQWAV